MEETVCEEKSPMVNDYTICHPERANLNVRHTRRVMRNEGSVFLLEDMLMLQPDP